MKIDKNTAKKYNVKDSDSVMSSVEYAIESAQLLHLSTHDDPGYLDRVNIVARPCGPDSAVVCATVTVVDTMNRRTNSTQNFMVSGAVHRILSDSAKINRAK